MKQLSTCIMISLVYLTFEEEKKTAFELSMPVPLHEMMNKIQIHSYCIIMCENFSYLHSKLHTSFSFLTIFIADRLARSCIWNSWRGGLSALLSASVNVCEYQWCFLTAFFGCLGFHMRLHTFGCEKVHPIYCIDSSDVLYIATCIMAMKGLTLTVLQAL